MTFVTAVVEDENHSAVSEEVNAPISLFPQGDDKRFPCLRFIDPYGDTIFNRLQIVEVLQELCVLREALTHDRERQTIIEQIEELARLCEKEPHLYLRFVGD